MTVVPPLLLTPPSRQADIVADILTNADTAEEYGALMMLLVGIIGTEAVMNNVKLMDILIVMICTLFVEPTAVPRSYWSVATAAAASATTITPTSSVSSRLCLSLPEMTCTAGAAERRRRDLRLRRMPIITKL